MTTILLFLAILFVLILVHEWGHYITAKKTGMQVDEFGIGFPPKLFGKKIGETEYTLNALPIGGFVRIVGENAEDIAAGEKGSVNPRSFVRKPKWAQAVVLVAGVVMNVLFAWLLYVVIFMVGTTTAVVDEANAPADSQLQITRVTPNSPVDEAGVPVGAFVVALTSDARKVTNLTVKQFQTFIAEHGNEPLSLTYYHNQATTTVSVTPRAGLVETEPNRSLIGVSLALVTFEKHDFLAALKKASVTTYETLGFVIVGLGSFLYDAVLYKADFEQVAGPVGIAGLVGEAAAGGFTSLLHFTAIISLNLAVINLLPVPALDGGRLVMVGIEAIIRRPINPVWVARLNAVGFILLILLMVAVTVGDVWRLLG